MLAAEAANPSHRVGRPSARSAATADRLIPRAIEPRVRWRAGELEGELPVE